MNLDWEKVDYSLANTQLKKCMTRNFDNDRARIYYKSKVIIRIPQLKNECDFTIKETYGLSLKVT